MGKREPYTRLLPVTVLLLLLLLHTQAGKSQENLLNREVSLSRTTGEISELLNELSRKGRFSFTYTSQIQPHRLASVLTKRQPVKNHLADIFRFDSIQFIEQNGKILLTPYRQRVHSSVPYKLIRGLVIDARSRRPLPYSSIFLLNRSTGTITNTSGRFELKVPPDESTDTLGISYIGYSLFRIPLSGVDTTSLVIRLSTEKVQIREIIVRPLDPIYIITKAIERIPENYDRKPSLFTAFFRETTRKDQKNISLSEAVIHIFKESYSSLRQDQIRIFKGRKGQYQEEKEFVDFVVQGGLYNTLQLDIVKNLPSFLDADYFALYEYQIDRIITHFDRPTYVIGFDQREGVKYPCFTGKLYVDVETLAIVGSSFELSQKSMSYATGIYVVKSPRKTGVRPVSARYEVFYRYYHDKWNLSNVRSDILIRVRRKKSNQQDRFNADFESTSEFVVTGRDTSNVARFRTNEVSRPRDVLVDQIGEVDKEFWGNENVITPDEPIEKTILRIGRRNNWLSPEEIATIRIEEEKEAEAQDQSRDMKHDAED